MLQFFYLYGVPKEKRGLEKSQGSGQKWPVANDVLYWSISACC